MNLKTLVYFSLFGLVYFHGNAQNASDELLKINNVPYTVGEFERIYTKNLDLIKDKEQKEIDNYLDLFVLYKLKVAKAYELGLDKKTAFQNEFASHRKQLAEQYLTNQETIEKLAKEAYQRSNYEIKASHIIFLADEFSTPADTLKAYNKALVVRNEILNGKDFNQAAIEYSEDPSVKDNKGDLGYFSVLRMVYPFETAAYNTPVGEISMPIRSQFGYHLIKIDDKRVKKGKRSVAQIFIDGNKDVVFDNSKIRIDKVYELLQNGVSFEELVLEYSDDTSSKFSNGVFKNYEPGLISILNLDEQVYNLEQVGDFSKPFKSQHGWHIVKLISDSSIPTFEEQKSLYLRKVQSDGRSRIVTNELVSYLKEKYDFKINTQNFNQFVKFIVNNISDTNYLEKIKNTKVLASFSNQKISEQDFADFIKDKGVDFAVINPIENAVNYVFNDFISERILKYYNDHLEDEFPDFKDTVQEFKEGLLLFDLVDVEVWKKAQNDTLGYSNYYQMHIDNFTKKASIKGKVYRSASYDNIKKAYKKAKKNFGKDLDFLKLENKTHKIIQGEFELGDKQLPEQYIFKQGVSDIFEKDGKFCFVVADEYFPEKTLSLEEAKQHVIYQYQQEYEKQWLLDIKQNADVIINTPTLNKLKEKYIDN